MFSHTHLGSGLRDLNHMFSAFISCFFCCHPILDYNNNNMWSANRPLSQSETELLRAQLNEVGPKELCCRLGARSLNTSHPCMTSEHSTTAWWNRPGVDFEEGGKLEYPEKNPRSQIEIDWNSAHIRPKARVEPRSQRWEARLMTTQPPWLP